MKAALIRQFGNPDVFTIEEKDKPQKLGPKQVLVKMYASSVNPIDFKQRKGNHRFIMGKPFPIQLGYDAAGVVEKVGDLVSRFVPGDRVFGVLDNKYGGALGEYAIGSEKCFATLAENISFSKGAALALAGQTALQALRDKTGGSITGKTILINGAAGGVGHLALQIAHIFGADTIAVTSEKHWRYVNELRPTKILDYKAKDILKSGFKVDIFFDCVGVYNYRKVRHMLNEYGVYITTLPRPKLLVDKLVAKFSKSKHARALLMKYRRDDLLQLQEWYNNKTLNVNIDKSFVIDEVSEAHRYAEQGHTEGKIAIIINQER